MYCFLKLFSFKLSYILFSKINFNLIIFYFLEILFINLIVLRDGVGITQFPDFGSFPLVFLAFLCCRLLIARKLWSEDHLEVAFIRVVFQFNFFLVV